MRGLCWIVLILTLWRTSLASLGRDTKDLKLQRVFVLCPNVTTQEVLFKLLIDREPAGNVTCNTENKSCKCSSLPPNGGVTFQDEGASVGFELQGARAKADAAYKCEAHKKYPPPYQSWDSERWFLVFHEELHTARTAPPEKDGPPWAWITVVALLGTYSLAVTITTFVLWFQLKDVDSQNDYENTKPPAPRHRAKKRGLQNPTPRYV
ncbi:hypothetical protein OJAV_G00016510 [Oryzias javanicus]|uniref:Immunoglobulin V-set domain-containing protein n=1 Tax=Oryzias javanicus TaxID=123683 RepID=A0A437DKI6_ORYJA|nr:hypothetical protein OJAV_G00016510 [Oryzias javanicus]